MLPTITGEEDRLAALRLARTERIGPATYRTLLTRYGSPREALAALPDIARRAGRKQPPRIASEAEARRELDFVEKLGGRILLLGEEDYPRLLAATSDPPVALTVQGNADILHRPAIAMVGARNASLNGRKFATNLARELGQAGFIVVSGLAAGIDTAAHEGSLETGTVAAMAGGIDVIYPRENEGLHGRLVESGAAVAEQRPGTETRSQLFPRRNRVIVGLSRAVIVVEATQRSGSLITARIAGEQGRDVFAVPGSPADPRSAGPNALIRDGAILLRDVQDVLAEISPHDEPHLRQAPEPFEGEALRGETGSEGGVEAARQALLERLTVTPTAVDELLRDCQLPAPDVLMAVLELEIAGEIIRHAGNRISLG